MNDRVPRCPRCGAPTVLDERNRWRPFCSQRCRLIDLGAWASGEHRIPGGPADGTGPPGGDEPPEHGPGAH